MKLKEGFVLKELAGECVVVPASAALDLDGMITLNETAKTLWLALEKGAEAEELVAALISEYEVGESLARSAVDAFLARLRELDLLA